MMNNYPAPAAGEVQRGCKITPYRRISDALPFLSDLRSVPYVMRDLPSGEVNAE